MSNDLDSRRPRVLFFGMQSRFSYPSLATLLKHGIEVCAVVMPATPLPGQQLPVIQRREIAPTETASRLARLALPLVDASPSIIQCASTNHIPVWEVTHLNNPEVLATLADYQPDMICVACFSLRLPRAVLAIPRLGSLNVHPSLLPANRGPLPLFWTFREGHKHTGVTIHMLDEGMDSGAILAQEVIPVSDGMSYDQLEAQCATRGALLLVRTVQALYEGRAHQAPQNEAESSYHSFPVSDDYVVQPQKWDAQHVFNFIRGVGRWNGPIELDTGEHSLLVQDAIAYSHEERVVEEHRDREEYRDGGIWVRCRVGWVKVWVIS